MTNCTLTLSSQDSSEVATPAPCWGRDTWWRPAWACVTWTWGRPCTATWSSRAETRVSTGSSRGWTETWASRHRQPWGLNWSLPMVRRRGDMVRGLEDPFSHLLDHSSKCKQIPISKIFHITNKNIFNLQVGEQTGIWRGWQVSSWQEMSIIIKSYQT